MEKELVVLLNNLHDSDWGWIDSQSYYAGARAMYWAVEKNKEQITPVNSDAKLKL
jgi:hypothetical protein